jgi:hypothetical protein
MHPEHGEPVVYLPGQLLPTWAAAALVAGRYTVDGGVYELVEPAKRRRAS